MRAMNNSPTALGPFCMLNLFIYLFFSVAWCSSQSVMESDDVRDPSETIWIKALQGSGKCKERRR